MDLQNNAFGAFQMLHLDHQLWESELNFYKDELKIFEKNLEKFVLKTTDQNQDLLADLEHFQNQFIRQKFVLDELMHDIRLGEQKISKEIQRGIQLQDADKIDHIQHNDRMETFRKIYYDLKAEFYGYMSKWN